MTELEMEWLKEIVVFVRVWSDIVWPVIVITLGFSVGNFVLLAGLHWRMSNE